MCVMMLLPIHKSYQPIGPKGNMVSRWNEWLALARTNQPVTPVAPVRLDNAARRPLPAGASNAVAVRVVNAASAAWSHDPEPDVEYLLLMQRPRLFALHLAKRTKGLTP